MPLIVDKRFLPKNNSANSRQKFIDRYKQTIKQRIRDIVGRNSIKDFKGGDKKIKIKIDNLDSPSFEFEEGTGNQDRIYIGNKKFKRGHKLKRPSGSRNGNNRNASRDGGESTDEFEFILTEEEYAKLFFEDLELPDLIKRQFNSNTYEVQHAGFSRSGGPSSLSVKKTILNSLGRRFIQRKKNELIEEMKNMEVIEDLGADEVSLEKFILVPKKKVQFIEDIDLRYILEKR